MEYPSKKYSNYYAYCKKYGAMRMKDSAEAWVAESLMCY